MNIDAEREEFKQIVGAYPCKWDERIDAYTEYGSITDLSKTMDSMLAGWRGARAEQAEEVAGLRAMVERLREQTHIIPRLPEGLNPARV